MKNRAIKTKKLTPAAKAKAKAEITVEALRTFAPKARLSKEEEVWTVTLTLPTTRRLAKKLELARQAEQRQHELDAEDRRMRTALTAAQMEIAALKTIMNNAGVPIPEDPPPEPRGKGSFVHRMPGSFEGGKRR